MPAATVEDGTPLRPVAPARGEVPAASPTVHHSTYIAHYEANPEMAVLRGGLGTREEIEGELDDMAAAIRGFHLKAPDQVLRECSAYGARLTELAVLLHRIESLDRQYVRIRTQQVQRYIEEIERQSKIASRLIEVARQDLALLTGQV